MSEEKKYVIREYSCKTCEINFQVIHSTNPELISNYCQWCGSIVEFLKVVKEGVYIIK